MSGHVPSPHAQRRVLARGAIGVDPRAALAKLREFMLPDPALYVAELVRATVELDARRIVIDNTARDFILTAELASPPPPQDKLVRLFEHLFANDERALRLLAIATNTALGLRPTFVDLYTTEQAPAREGSAALRARVRFVPTTPDDADEALALDGSLSWVASPPGLTEHALRVHVRERFSTHVMREWFGEPVESKVLRTRCLLVPVPIVRAVDGAPIDRGEPPTALVRVPLQEKLRGEIALVRPQERDPNVIDFYERGVLLSRETLAGGQERAPNLRAWIDERALPTNVSRSAVDRSGPFGRQLERALADGRARLIPAAIEALSGPHGAEVAHALRSLILARFGRDWPAIARRPPLAGDESYLLPLLKAPMIPTVTGGHCSLGSLVERLDDSNEAVMVLRGETLPPASLAPWLAHVVHGSDETVSRLLEPLDPQDASVALARAEEALERFKKFRAHKPRAPSVPSAGANELVRAPLAKPRSDDRAQIPPLTIDTLALEGELVLERPTGADRAMELTIFLEGRPLPPTTEKEGPLLLRAAVQCEGLEPRPDFSGPMRTAAFERCVSAVLEAAGEALRFAAVFLADPKKLDADPRVHWMGPAAHKLSALDRASIVLSALYAVTERRATQAARRSLEALLAAHPELGRVPLFSASSQRLFTIDELRLVAGRHGGRVLHTRHDRRVEHPALPVFILDERQQRLVELLIERCQLVDYSRFSAKQGETLASLVSRDDAGPWLELIGTHARAMISVAPRAGHLAVVHRGQVIVSSTDSSPLGKCLLRIEDQAFIPTVGKDSTAQSLSEDASALYTEGPFDLLYALLRAIGGDSEALRQLSLPLRWRPPQHVLSFLFVSAARLRALDPDAVRGTIHKVSHGQLLRLCEELPLVRVRTASGVETVSLSALRAKAKAQAGPLATLEDAPDDVDYDATFEPILVSRGDFEAALAIALGAKLAPAEPTLQGRRDARKLRLARERFALRPKVSFEDLSEFRASHVVTVEHETYSCVMGLLPTPGRARVQVVVDERVAFSSEFDDAELGDCPVAMRIRPRSPDKCLEPTLDALTSAGRSMLTAAARRALKKLVESVCKSADGTHDPGAAARALVTVFCANAARVDDKLRARVGRAVLWKAVPVGLASAEQCAAHGRGRVLYVQAHFDPWIPAPDGETDPVAAFVEPTPRAPRETREAAQAERKRFLAALESITDLSPKDATEEFDRLQRARRILRSARENVVLPGNAAHPALACRIEQHDPKLGVGELRLRTSGEAKLSLHVFFEGSFVRELEQPAPIALSVALESSLLSAQQARSGPIPDNLVSRVLSVAKKLLSDAMKRPDALPEWSLSAQRWAALTGGATTKSARARPIFPDTTGRYLSLDDLDAQQREFGHVSYTLDPDPTPVRPLDERRRVWRTDEREASWLSGTRVPMNYTEALRDEQRALARRNMPPARRIVVREHAPLGSIVFELNVAAHEFEGEVVLLPSSRPPMAKVFFWHDRRPLGETEAPASWPALVAIEASELTPNRAESAPVETPVFHRTRARAAELVRAALDAQFNAPPHALASIRAERLTPSVRSGSTRALGMLWLLEDPLEPGRIEVREPGESTLRGHFTKQAIESPSVPSIPVSGQLWFNYDAKDGGPIPKQVAEILRAAYRALLGQLVSNKRASLEHQLAHMAYAAAARVIDSDVLKRWASDRLLPDSCTTVARAAEHFAHSGTLELCPEGDARASQERFVVPRSKDRWFSVLEELALVQVPTRPEAPEAREALPPAAPPDAEATARPAPSAPVTTTPSTASTTPITVPASERPEIPSPARVKPEASAPTIAELVLAILRRHGVVERDLERVELDEATRSGPIASYNRDRRAAVIAVRHDAIARLITGRDPTRAHRVLAMAVLGEVNRALQRFTDADEAQALLSLLRELAAPPAERSERSPRTGG